MKLSSRLTMIASIIASIYVSMIVFMPQTIRACGLDVWEYPAEEARLEAEIARSAQLTEESDEIALRIQLREQLIQDLIAGEATFEQTIEAFRKFNELNPMYAEISETLYPEQSIHQRTVDQVLHYCKQRIMHNQNRPRDPKRLRAIQTMAKAYLEIH